ncbi:MAG: F0F1 ATP synthase subunit gamma [Alphaproteobacteria bacterium]|nr:F0F1 ATP synthase subunit gamma [Alphaproteobacteria bacterium]
MSLEALQRKIKTTGELREIVSTMKTLSSASILQYEQANISLRSYRRNLRDAFHALIRQKGLPPISKPRGAEKHLQIVIGSDNGMVGKFNREIFQAVHKDLKKQNLMIKETLFITVGKRMTMLANQQKLTLSAQYAVANSVKAVSILAESLILDLDRLIPEQKITHVDIWFHKRGKSSSVKVEKRQIIPFNNTALRQLKDKPWETNNLPMLPQNTQRLFSSLIRESLIMSLSGAINYSLAAEHFTRMTNMQNAEKNIDENLAELNQEYQQQRQEQITDELIDIISGAEAMKKK